MENQIGEELVELVPFRDSKGTNETFLSIAQAKEFAEAQGHVDCCDYVWCVNDCQCAWWSVGLVVGTFSLISAAIVFAIIGGDKTIPIIGIGGLCLILAGLANALSFGPPSCWVLWNSYKYWIRDTDLKEIVVLLKTYPNSKAALTPNDLERIAKYLLQEKLEIGLFEDQEQNRIDTLTAGILKKLSALQVFVLVLANPERVYELAEEDAFSKDAAKHIEIILRLRNGETVELDDPVVKEIFSYLPALVEILPINIQENVAAHFNMLKDESGSWFVSTLKNVVVIGDDVSSARRLMIAGSLTNWPCWNA